MFRFLRHRSRNTRRARVGRVEALGEMAICSPTLTKMKPPLVRNPGPKVSCDFVIVYKTGKHSEFFKLTSEIR
jgi:hypothetical protein